MRLYIIVKNLMYGFGDDRNPANDTVGVMEEILIEYITDVVCFFFSLSNLFFKVLNKTVPICRWSYTKVTFIGRRSSSRSIETSRCKETCKNGRAPFHARRY